MGRPLPDGGSLAPALSIDYCRSMLLEIFSFWLTSFLEIGHFFGAYWSLTYFYCVRCFSRVSRPSQYNCLINCGNLLLRVSATTPLTLLSNSIINDNNMVILKHKMKRSRWDVRLKQYKNYFMVWTSEIFNDDGN